MSIKFRDCDRSRSYLLPPSLDSGTIDNPETQKQIVTIMEGGKEAFNRRKNIYELWSNK